MKASGFFGRAWVFCNRKCCLTAIDSPSESLRLVRNLAGDCRCEELRLIHHQHRVPVSRCCLYARSNTGGEARRFIRRIDFRSRLVGGKITLQPEQSPWRVAMVGQEVYGQRASKVKKRRIAAAGQGAEKSRSI